MKQRSVYINGNIHTLDKRKRVQAFAVDRGVIAETGSNIELKPLARRGYTVIDFKGKCVIPGMIDSHLHLLGLGNLFSRVNLDGIASFEDVSKLVGKAASGLSVGQWLRGRGWNKNLWGEKFPDKSMLDRITDNPVALNSKDGHLLWVNSAALRICGIDETTKNPAGGVILKDANGAPTGILQENAVNLVTDKIPPQDDRERVRAILKAQNHLFRLGVTGVGDCDTEQTLVSIYKELAEAGKLRLRVFKMISPDYLDSAIDQGLTTGSGNERLRAGCLKLYADGALGSQTALMYRPYNRSGGNRGVETLTPVELNRYFAKAGPAGISVAIHAIGDRANSQVLTAFEAHSAMFSKKRLRPRIEHAQILRKKDIPLFRKFGVIASVQPIHAISDRDVSDRYLGTRGRYAYPFRTMLENGIRLAFGSDAPIEIADPLAGIYAAVTRKRPSETRKAWYPEERLTVRQAIEAYTVGSAYACCFDDIAGNISPGKRADFVVISDDIFKIKSGKLHKVKIVSTVTGGKIVYGRNNL